MKDIEAELAAFAAERGFTEPDSMLMAIAVTRIAGRVGFPLGSDSLVVQDDDGGSGATGLHDCDAERPLSLHFDRSISLTAIIHDLLQQAEMRQRGGSGAMYAGAVMQHLVGAKLDIVLGRVEHHGASVADQGTGRAADFAVGDVAIHVTAAPGEGLIRKCTRNLDKRLRPLVVTTARGVAVAQGLAEQAGIADRVDVLDTEQFLAGNLYEHGGFELAGRQETAERLVAKYNEIVQKYETDPSLCITIGD